MFSEQSVLLSLVKIFCHSKWLSSVTEENVKKSHHGTVVGLESDIGLDTGRPEFRFTLSPGSHWMTLDQSLPSFSHWIVMKSQGEGTMYFALSSFGKGWDTNVLNK